MGHSLELAEIMAASVNVRTARCLSHLSAKKKSYYVALAVLELTMKIRLWLHNPLACLLGRILQMYVSIPSLGTLFKQEICFPNLGSAEIESRLTLLSS